MPVLFFPPFRLIEARLYGILSVVSPPLPAQPGAVVVAIGEIGQRWPWSRELHARLVESLRAAGAKVIAFDIIFADPTMEETDTAFANAIGNLAILFNDQTQIRVGRNSTLTVNDMAGGSSDATQLSLQGGNIWAHAARGGSGVDVKTPAAVAAIRLDGNLV